MSLANTYRRKSEQLRKDIANLQKQKATEVKKVADTARKINDAQRSIKSARSDSTIRSTYSRIEGFQNERARTEKKIADLEQKIARKEDEYGRAQESLLKEEERDTKKRQQEDDRLAKKREEQFRRLSHQVDHHQQLHTETRSLIEELRKLPQRIVVLFLAANPIDQEQLRLDEEIRAIDEMIRKSEHRDSIQLVSKWAVRPMDVLQALNEYSPHIVHFSGHGSDTDEIVFMDNEGNAKAVSKEAIVQTMLAAMGNIRLIFFNTCYSRGQAEAVVNHVPAAIGMKTSIGDSAARIFASQFYSAIGFGKSVTDAFEQGKALLMMENIPEEDTPELFISDGLNGDELIIVRPEHLDPNETEEVF